MLLLCTKDPLKAPKLAAREERGHHPSRGEEQMEFRKTIYTLWMLLPPPSNPSNLRGSDVAQACRGRLPSTECWCDT